MLTSPPSTSTSSPSCSLVGPNRRREAALGGRSVRRTTWPLAIRRASTSSRSWRSSSKTYNLGTLGVEAFFEALKALVAEMEEEERSSRKGLGGQSGCGVGLHLQPAPAEADGSFGSMRVSAGGSRADIGCSMGM